MERNPGIESDQIGRPEGDARRRRLDAAGRVWDAALAWTDALRKVYLEITTECDLD